jgi:hypothetical protein
MQPVAFVDDSKTAIRHPVIAFLEGFDGLLKNSLSLLDLGHHVIADLRIGRLGNTNKEGQDKR